MEEKKFDLNSIIGLVLMGAIAFWYIFTQKPEEPKVEQKPEVTVEKESTKQIDNSNTLQVSPLSNDSINKVAYFNKYGDFATNAINGIDLNGLTTVENEFVQLKISNKGGQIVEALLKKHLTYDGKPLYLINENNASFNIDFKTNKNRIVHTKDLIFKPEFKSLNDKQILTLKAFVSNKEYLVYQYQIYPENHMIDFTVQTVGLEYLINSSEPVELALDYKGFRHEKSVTYENQHTALYYEKNEGKIDDLSISGEDEEEEENVNWFGFKQHFFSSIFISNKAFDKAELKSYSIADKEDIQQPFTKRFTVKAPLTLENGNINYAFQWYLGPNDYKLLKSYNKQIHEVIDLGWGIFGWINRNAFMPLFNLLGKFISNYGLLIIIMTVVVRFFMSPLVYKSYVSSAKMKVIKPEMQEINDKYPGKDQALKRQQEIMALQKKAGVSMLSGCIPALIQMPVFFALFRFFPSNINLRQKSFLWADDLSSYDSVYKLPFSIPFYGDHISLFPILASIAIFVYVRMNQNQQMSMQQPQQEGMPDMQKMMKSMMYISPLMMLFLFNNYGAGLSLYYFISNLLTITIMLVIKYVIIDEAKIHAQVQENKKKPVKRSKFRERLDEAMKQAQEQQQMQQKRKK